MSTNSEAGATEARSKAQDQVGRFHTTQALSILVVFAVLIAVFFAMLAKQYHLFQRHEKEMLHRQFTERVAYLENLLATVTRHVDGLRTVAEADFLQTRAGQSFIQPIEFNHLFEVASEKRFSLDTFEPPLTRAMIGNLTGEGSLRDRGHDFYREIHMALILNPQFHVVAKSMKNAAWVYYTSRNNFLNIYPWVSSSDFKYSKELQTHEFYTLGLPENNPDHRMFWTKVYVDEYGKGLMTTCAAPVYDQDRFMGTVAVDLTVDFLNTVVGDFNPDHGGMFLVNNHDQLVAHATLITSGDQTTKPWAEALPEELRDSIEFIKQTPDDEFIRAGAYDLLSSRLEQAPWRVIYLHPVHSFWSSLTELIGLGPLIVLALLLLLVVAVLVFTERQFVSPSKKFVNYIMAGSQRSRTEMGLGLPRVWRPWFAAVEKVFDENDKLTEELRKHNVELEERVRQRTAELVQEVEERRQVQVTLKKSEERFRDMSDLLPSTIVELDSRFNITYINQLGLKLFGYTKQDMASGINVLDLIHPDDRENAVKVLTGPPEEESPVSTEYRVLQKDKEFAWAQFKASPIYQDEAMVGFRVVLDDISKRKKVEKQRELLIAELQKALAEIKELRGFLPICSSCKKIRDDEGYWQQVEQYIQDRTDAQFSHSICPDCAKRIYPEFYKD
jgi:PAS domain S-box-containing protein